MKVGFIQSLFRLGPEIDVNWFITVMCLIYPISEVSITMFLQSIPLQTYN